MTRFLRKFHYGEKGFTLIELLVVVAILGVLAAVAVPNVGKFIGKGKTEAYETELHNVQTAVTAMMADNKIDTLPNPVVIATNDMGAFPDVTSVAGSSKKLKDANRNPYGPGDKNGYLLYGHDATADNDNTTLVNYVVQRYTRGTYRVNAAGQVTQVTTP